MAEIRHLENRHDVIFSAKAGPIWIKFCRLVQNDMSTAVIWSKSKPDVEFQYGGLLGEFNGMSSQSHLSHFGCCHLANSMSWSQIYVSHWRVLPPGEFLIPVPHATLQDVRIPSAILKIIIHHILLIFLFFYFSLSFDKRWLSCRLQYTCSGIVPKIRIDPRTLFN